ncbi:MAG: asparagine synthase (glutamine-hydrolyzing) [Bacteroidota bacterium]
MCGIAGIFNFDITKQVNTSSIDLLTDAVKHRGPDGRGVWFNTEKNLALGHRRLSILDTSENGSQPMTYASNRYVITLNGEIYNFLEIRLELEKLGLNFVSNSDTEVILAAYLTWGENMLHKFNGMWAFAIYDNQNKTLFLSRDRFGVKPLYYSKNDTSFIFSSEVQAIQKLLPNCPLNKQVIANIVDGGFHSYGTIETYLENVFALPGGHNILISQSEVKIYSWYQLKKIVVPKTFSLQTQELKNLILDACKLRMRSDVPIATCLSGGVDSGTITAFLASDLISKEKRFENYTHKGFCAAFPNTPIDESNEARRLANQLHTKLDVVNISAPKTNELIQAMQMCDGPMHALAFFPIWKLYKHIKENNILVTLDGQGPDEMMGGYRPIYEALDAAISLKKPLWFLDVYKTYAAQGETKNFSSKKFVKNQTITLLRTRVNYLKNKIKAGIGLQKDIEPFYDFQNFKYVNSPPENYNALDKNLYQQFFQTPLPGILQQYDRCSMANGVECRMPFMDYRIVEFVFSLPVESKVGGGYTKRILREASKGILPDETRLNKLKIGFNAPIIDWFKGELKDFMLEQMSSKEFIESNYFNGKKLKKDFADFLESKNNNWDDAWKFWPPVHLTWWLKNKN